MFEILDDNKCPFCKETFVNMMGFPSCPNSHLRTWKALEGSRMFRIWLQPDIRDKSKLDLVCYNKIGRPAFFLYIEDQNDIELPIFDPFEYTYEELIAKIQYLLPFL